MAFVGFPRYFDVALGIASSNSDNASFIPSSKHRNWQNVGSHVFSDGVWLLSPTDKRLLVKGGDFKMSTEKRPDQYRAVELTEELVEQLSLFLISTTQSPEDLVANSCFEHVCQRECDSLIELCTSDSFDDAQVWQHICKLLIKVGTKVEDRIRNSINCILPGYSIPTHIEYPGILVPQT
jgi:hypothetical protein